MSTPYTENAVGLPEKIMYGNQFLYKFYVHGTYASGYNQFWRVMYASSRHAIREHYKKCRPGEVIHGWKRTTDAQTSYYGMVIPWYTNTKNASVYIPKDEIMQYAWTDGEEKTMNPHVSTVNNFAMNCIRSEQQQNYGGNYVIMVKFNQLSPGHTSPGHKTYGYMTNDSSIKAGDFVAVMSPTTGVCAVEVVDVLLRRDVQYNATKWIIGKIDLTAYKTREANEKRLKEVRRELDRKKAELVAKYDLQMISEDSPDGAKLVDEYENLMKALGETDY